MKTVNETIISHPFFRGMKIDHLNQLVQGAKTGQCKTGEILFREKEPANQFFLLESGRIALETRELEGSQHIQTLSAGDVLGWSWLFPPFTWHFQARAIEPTKFIILDGSHLLATAERDRDFGYALMKRVAQVVIQRLQASRKQLLAAQSGTVPA